jgi:hypothetical protein
MSEQRIGRYLLVDEVSSTATGTQLWFARDEILDRPVAIRVMNADDPRAASVLGAARAAARVDDRRLLRVLDVINVPADENHPERVAIVSEWASGRTLPDIVQADGPLDPTTALNVVAEVAAGISAGLQRHVSHGRLRPSSVLVTDAGEVRVRGLAVDAALMGAMPADVPKEQADVDGLGAMLAYLNTGLWPGSPEVHLPPTPQHNGVPLAPSQIHANVPRAIDDVVARSLRSATRPKGVTNVSDATAFAAIARSALAQAAPVSRGPRPYSTTLRKLVGVVLAAAAVVVIGFVGFTLINSADPVLAPASEVEEVDILTLTQTPSTSAPDEPGDVVYEIVKGRSFDPFGDDNNDGKPDRRKGRENNKDRGLAIDGDVSTLWLTDRYDSADLDGKPGVGYIADLGEPQTIRSITVLLNRPGADVQIAVASEIFADPDLWTPFADVRVSSDEVTVRSPRPVEGQYVLVWFTRLPADPDASRAYQGGIADIIIRG